MSELKEYLFFMLDWVVGPTLCFIAIALHVKHRKTPTLLMVVGMSLLLLAQVLRLLYPAPLHPANLAALALESVGLVASIVGFVQFWRQIYRLKVMESNPPLNSDARQEPPRAG